ncbi:HigA family addiction module antitoxin [Xylella fastidiosa]|uniref:HigA family addiction module antitoxin n=1 Tax=Xylella fastidiosa TaxID=2371 RepID=UPI00097646BC|nr:HigA family addiction module antitoxin [Xylella fastidiosa]KAJ4853437.1 HigA family addiction module antitoxin [Xylella fastidiosa subsp. multiplex]MDC6410515.1 HigA family addiction module antitoxin [Xylella fastidiosa subsp. multiplex]MDC6412931.1 HigA family addiction module antitoxin [Xylella fastidiosa subsp. multiplex]MDC6416198.1 HigA family addiction module antitoxin [Xylella fastidiosa subsp. multiplex]MDC6418478.1 HigA family addiction module antitoxin [Xylella fastidiosa subsp. m
MNTFAEVFPPGEFLRDELEARHWTQTELAEIIGRPVHTINEIIAGKKAITPETAIQLGKSLGTGPEVWMNLESQYQLSKVSGVDEQISRRAELYSRFPIRQMIKRGWISASKNIDVLEQQVLEFFGIKHLNEQILLSHAAKKTDANSAVSNLQLAWLRRAWQVADELITSAYSEVALHQSLSRLSTLRTAPEETRHVARILHECGVRFVIVEPIAGTKIDGACFWLADDKPVVAMTLRLDRIDNFWFVLRHELEHVLQHHARNQQYILDQEIDSESGTVITEDEKIANDAGTEFCVPQNELAGFVARVSPFFKEERVLMFAQRLNIHPGLVVGQLQRYLHRYDFFRKYQVKVRSFVTSSARTDGWGVLRAD